MEGSDDDAQGQSKHTVLWEKCIHQSIYVDLSENESLNLSDLERSLLLHVSQDQSAASVPSIHLTGRSSSHRCCFKIPFSYIITLFCTTLSEFAGMYIFKHLDFLNYYLFVNYIFICKSEELWAYNKNIVQTVKLIQSSFNI